MTLLTCINTVLYWKNFYFCNKLCLFIKNLCHILEILVFVRATGGFRKKSKKIHAWDSFLFLGFREECWCFQPHVFKFVTEATQLYVHSGLQARDARPRPSPLFQVEDQMTKLKIIIFTKLKSKRLPDFMVVGFVLANSNKQTWLQPVRCKELHYTHFLAIFWPQSSNIGKMSQRWLLMVP